MSRTKSFDKPITVSYGDRYTEIDVLHVTDGTATPETVRLDGVTVARNATANTICAILDKYGYSRDGMSGYLFFDGNRVNVERGTVFHVMPQTVIEHGTTIKPDAPDSEIVEVKSHTSQCPFYVVSKDNEDAVVMFTFDGTVLPYRKYCAFADEYANAHGGFALVLTNDRAKRISGVVTYYATIEQLKPYAMSDKEFAAALRNSGATEN